MWRTCAPSCGAQGPIHSLAEGQAGRLVGRRSARAKTAGPGRQSPAPGFVPVDTPETPSASREGRDTRQHSGKASHK